MKFPKFPEANCKLPVVANFLCCYSLEIGGLALGWFTAIMSAIGLISIITVMALNPFAARELKGRKFICGSHQLFCLSFCVRLGCFYYLFRNPRLCGCSTDQRNQKCELLRNFSLTTKCQTIKIFQRNHYQMKWFLWIMAIGAILSFLQILIPNPVGIFLAILVSAIYSYFFICIYSLYESVKA